MRVLIIDDEADFRKKTTAVLEAMGHKVIQVASGACALRRMECESVDIALLDLWLRKENGLD
ncbi:MAG: response regulator [Opitutales bacterium]